MAAFCAVAVATGAWLVLEEVPPEDGGRLAALEQDEPEGLPGLALRATERPAEVRPAEAEGRADLRTAGQPDSGPAPAISVVSIEGRIVDRAGLPVARAEVSLLAGRGPPPPRQRGGAPRGWRFAPRAAGKPARTRADGRFSIRMEARERSSLWIRVRHSEFAPTLVAKRWQQTPDELQLGDIVLGPGALAFGRVTAQAGGAPLAEVEVRFSAAEPQRSYLDELVAPVRTDARGRFEIHHVPRGEFRLRFDLPRYVPAVTEKLAADDDKRIDAGNVQLELGSAVSGVVLDHHGKPIVGAEVEGSLSVGAESAALKREFEDLRVIARANPGGRPDAERVRQLLTRMRGKRWIRQRDKTGARGEFTLEGLPNGSLRLVARHASFIDEVLDPLRPAPAQRVEIRMYRRLAVSGVVIDARSSQPVERYGIRARRIRGEDPMRARRPPRRIRTADRPDSALARIKKQAARIKAAAQASKLSEARRKKLAAYQKALAEQQARREAQLRQRELARRDRDSQRAVMRQSREAYLKQRLGSTGQIPGPIPPATGHPDGEFLLEGLQPGTYVLDVGGPGYVKLAAGPITLERGKPVPRVTIRLTRGQSLAGRVLDRADGRPIVGADIELFLPEVRPAAPPADPFLQAMRPQGLGLRIEHGRTDGKGAFELAPQRPGTFRLRIRAESYNTHVEDVTLQPNQGLEGQLYQLGAAARVHGTVLNREADTKYQVILASTRGQRKFVPVDPETGTYEATGLEAGDWYVRLHREGSPGGMFRRAIEAVTRPGGTKPDLVLREGMALRFNLDAGLDDLSAVAGRILWNGQPASGFELKLTPDPGTLTSPGLSDPRGRRLVQRMLEGILRGRTDRKGNFRIEMVPPGSYRLEVRRRTRRPQRGLGRRRDGVVYRQTVVVSKGRQLRLRLDLQTGRVRFEVTDAASGFPVGARVVLALALETSGREPKEWRTLPSFLTASLRGSRSVELHDVAVGEYEYFVYGGGIVPQGGRFFVGSGVNEPRKIRVQRRQKRGKNPSGKRGKSPRRSDQSSR